MTVKELKECLDQFNDDLEVVIRVVGEYAYIHDITDSNDISEELDMCGKPRIEIVVYE